jgi:hypothetical protein
LVAKHDSGGVGERGKSKPNQVRMTFREQDTAPPPGTERITEVVATEIIRHSKQAR